MTAQLTGSCLCGAIQYTISAPVAELRACHCTNCQKISGAGGTVNAIVASKDFRIVKGTPKRFTKTADSGRVLHRYFCGDCGSGIYTQRELTPERVVVRAGAFDNPPPMKIGAHIWTRSARNWDLIDPAAQQVPGQPD
ncbi:MAG TPA: GFA family protein [Burkholderiales bacterium]|nr:GFA family protein [Burkholderiales bacterium]